MKNDLRGNSRFPADAIRARCHFRRLWNFLLSRSPTAAIPEKRQRGK
ncbi:hypothetical protein KCP74_04940 [Salmonella enterica subsp. enterica]|nr:hypothetical protein KCP74_04940 [Salmonella enterica subsp. enterica]